MNFQSRERVKNSGSWGNSHAATNEKNRKAPLFNGNVWIEKHELPTAVYNATQNYSASDTGTNWGRNNGVARVKTTWHISPEAY